MDQLQAAMQILNLAGDCDGMMADLSNNNGKGYAVNYQPRPVFGKPVKAGTVIFLNRINSERELANAIAELSGIIAAQITSS